MDKIKKKLLRGIIIMALLSPLGIILPKLFNADDAWGEWGIDTIRKMLGFVPEGMKRDAELWKAPLTDYTIGSGESCFMAQIGSYLVSAAIGIALLMLIFFVVSRLYKHEK